MVREPTPRAGPTGFSIEWYRRARFGTGPVCPHCGGRKLHRWGTFSGRQRHRCVGCGRTFSDFTETPLAYLKRLDRIGPFVDWMLASATVRATAAGVGIDPTTAFRWRHRLLAALATEDMGALRGDVVLDYALFPFSEKGSRRLDRPARRRAYPFGWTVSPVWVLLAVDDQDDALAEVTGRRRPRRHELARVLAPRLGAGARIVANEGSFGEIPAFARAVGHPYRRIAPPAPPGDQRGARWRVRLHRWMRRFHGVASRYLPNYLAWHRLVANLDGRPAAPPSRARARLLAARAG